MFNLKYRIVAISVLIIPSINTWIICWIVRQSTGNNVPRLNGHTKVIGKVSFFTSGQRSERLASELKYHYDTQYKKNLKKDYYEDSHG